MAATAEETEEALGYARGAIAHLQQLCRSGGDPEKLVRKIDQFCGFALEKIGGTPGTPLEETDDETTLTDVVLELRRNTKWLQRIHRQASAAGG